MLRYTLVIEPDMRLTYLRGHSTQANCQVLFKLTQKLAVEVGGLPHSVPGMLVLKHL